MDEYKSSFFLAKNSLALVPKKMGTEIVERYQKNGDKDARGDFRGSK